MNKKPTSQMSQKEYNRYFLNPAIKKCDIAISKLKYMIADHKLHIEAHKKCPFINHYAIEDHEEAIEYYKEQLKYAYSLKKKFIEGKKK
jgi:hypothetical protein